VGFFLYLFLHLGLISEVNCHHDLGDLLVTVSGQLTVFGNDLGLLLSGDRWQLTALLSIFGNS
jgi:hypothetical protein